MDKRKVCPLLRKPMLLNSTEIMVNEVYENCVNLKQ